MTSAHRRACVCHSLTSPWFYFRHNLYGALKIRRVNFWNSVHTATMLTSAWVNIRHLLGWFAANVCSSRFHCASISDSFLWVFSENVPRISLTSSHSDCPHVTSIISHGDMSLHLYTSRVTLSQTHLISGKGIGTSKQFYYCSSPLLIYLSPSRALESERY